MLLVLGNAVTIINNNITNNTSRLRKSRLAPIILNEKRGVLTWMKWVMVLRAKTHKLKMKRTKVFLFKWVVSAVHKKADRALIRAHFVPLLNEYRKRCYQKAWNITWGRRLREGWVAWNDEVITTSHLKYYNNTNNNTNRSPVSKR